MAFSPVTTPSTDDADGVVTIASPDSAVQPGVSALQSASPLAPSILDLRLPQNFGEIASGRRVLTAVPVGKVPKFFFFRRHPGPQACANMALLDATKFGGDGVYAVSSSICSLLPDQVRLSTLYLVVTSQGDPYLVPVSLPGADGRVNPWHASLACGLNIAATKWVRLTANMGRGAYDVFEAVGDLPEPVWPPQSFDELLEIAFSGRMITTADHPLVMQLLGAA